MMTTRFPKTPFARTGSLLCMASLLAFLAACNKSDDAAKEANEDKPVAVAQTESGLKLSDDDIKRAGIRLEDLQLQDIKDAVTVTATIRPDQDRMARVAPRVEGRIVSVAATLGQQVKAGQALASLDSLALGEAYSAYQQALAAQRVAQADARRAETLAAEEIVAQRDVLRSKAELDKSSAELRAAEDKLRMLGAIPKSSDSRGAMSLTLTAPFAGTIIEKKATLGELASPSDALFTVADLSHLWIEGNLTEAMLARVRTGAKASVSVAAYPGERFEGRVTYLASTLDKESRTVAARIEVANKDGRLKPEMFATASIETQAQSSKALVVADEAIILLQGQPSVFVADGNGFVARPIEAGEKLGGRTVIKSGLATGDKIVAAGAYALKAQLLKSQISDEH